MKRILLILCLCLCAFRICAADSLYFKKRFFIVRAGWVAELFANRSPQKHFNYNASVHFFYYNNGRVALATGAEYEKISVYVGDVPMGHSSSITNLTNTYHTFSIPLYFNWWNRSKEMLLGFGPLLSYNYLVHSSYDYKDYNSTYITIGHAEENNTGDLFFRLCLRADYFMSVSKRNSLVIGARLTGWHKYYDGSVDGGFYRDINFNLSAGLTF